MRIALCLSTVLILGLPQIAAAGARDGRLLGSGGSLQIEGASGGGLVPWATIAGYASEDQVGFAAAASVVDADPVTMQSLSAAVGVHNRFEVSLNAQRLRMGATDLTLRTDALGLKYRLAGDLIYGERPQWTLGVLAKHAHRSGLLDRLPGDRRSDIEPYLSAGRLWLNGPFGRSWLLNTTLRASRARQIGLLGFGDDWHLLPEVSAAVLLDRRWALGVEYRVKAHSDVIGRDDDWRDVFVAYTPNKTLRLVLAATDLGHVVGDERATGMFFSLQVTP